MRWQPWCKHAPDVDSWLQDTSSTGVVRDIIDNSTYKWIKVPEPDTEWVIKAVDGISEMRDTTLDKMQSSKTPKAYQ